MSNTDADFTTWIEPVGSLNYQQPSRLGHDPPLLQLSYSQEVRWPDVDWIGATPANPASIATPAHPAASPMNIFDRRGRGFHERQGAVYRQCEGHASESHKGRAQRGRGRHLRTRFVLAIMFDSPTNLLSPPSTDLMEERRHPP